MRISDWSSDVCSSDLNHGVERGGIALAGRILRRGHQVRSVDEELDDLRDGLRSGFDRTDEQPACVYPDPGQGKVDVFCKLRAQHPGDHTDIASRWRPAPQPEQKIAQRIGDEAAKADHPCEIESATGR